MIGLIVGLFGVCAAYVAWCDRIVGREATTGEPITAPTSSATDAASTTVDDGLRSVRS